MRKNRQTYLCALILFTIHGAFGQIDGKSWHDVATKMPITWYGSSEAKTIANNVLLAQKTIGGWEKNKPYHKPFTQEEQEHYQSSKNDIGATFDNGATTTEMLFLAKVYSQSQIESYKNAFEKALNYIFVSQYSNGGWPQFYPVRTGSVSYSGHITYNDDAMVNIMNFLKRVYQNDPELMALHISPKTKNKALQSYEKGVECFLDTQIKVAGKPTVWCAQHDEKTLLPAKARSYELPSFSGSESVGILELLMQIEHPNQRTKEAIKGAVTWFDSHKIEGIKVETEMTAQNTKNRIVVKDKNATPLWARFYDLNTEKPYFCDRDGIKKSALSEIGYERRNGYSWYTSRPARALQAYPAWQQKHLN